MPPELSQWPSPGPPPPGLPCCVKQYTVLSSRSGSCGRTGPDGGTQPAGAGTGGSGTEDEPAGLGTGPRYHEARELNIPGGCAATEAQRREEGPRPCCLPLAPRVPVITDSHFSACDSVPGREKHKWRLLPEDTHPFHGRPPQSVRSCARSPRDALRYLRGRNVCFPPGAHPSLRVCQAPPKATAHQSNLTAL